MVAILFQTPRKWDHTGSCCCMVAILFKANPKMCLICDQYRRIQVHVAAINGQTDVLKWPIQAKCNIVWMKTAEKDAWNSAFVCDE